MNLRLLRDRSFEPQEGIEVPSWIYFNGKIQASVRVSWQIGKGAITSQTRQQLMTCAIEAFVDAQLEIRDLKDQDAEVLFYYLDWNPDGSNLHRVEFARFANKELTFH